MDANGLRSFGLSYGRGLNGWRVIDSTGVPRVAVEHSSCHLIDAVRLANRAALEPFTETATDAGDVVLQPAIARDRFGNYVVWHAGRKTLYSVSATAIENRLEPVAVPLPEGAAPVRDLAMGADDVLYVAGANGVWLIDMRARFEPFQLAAAGFEAHKLTADAQQGVWALDVTNGRVSRVTGLPQFTTGVDLLRERNQRFEAAESAAQPPALRVMTATLDTSERAVALASHKDTVAVLVVGGERASLRVLTDEQRWSAPIRFDGPRFPHSFGFLSDEQFAVLADVTALAPDGTPQSQRDLGAFIYRLDASVLRQACQYPKTTLDPLAPLGDYYPLTGRTSGPLANAAPGSTPRLYFPRQRQWMMSGVELNLPEPAPLSRLSLAARATYGVVANFAQNDAGKAIRSAVGVIDTRDATTAWHRLYIEATVPRGAAMIVWLAANDGAPPHFELDANERDATHEATWFPHLVGDAAALPSSMRLAPATPRATWLQEPSEVPLGRSLLEGERQPNVSGLFSVLVQRAGLTVRTLRGQRLWAVIELFGDSRATVELVALRAYASRFSYRDKYLPALYHEQLYGAEADRPGPATPADFLERFIDLFEGVLTSMEDRIANAHLFTDVAACPADTLPWLGTWIGFALEDLRGLASTHRARNMLLNAPLLARRHGTLDGLRWMLDIATDGAVTRGRIVVIENFRLRRTLATILGADLAEENDPLTLGITQTGNSFVGDSLFLGDESVKTFLALFRSLTPDAGAESYEAQRQRDEREAALHALYDGLAHRVTVLVHEATDADELRRVRKLAAESAPAHVAVNVVAAKYPFIAAVASLVGADTYLRAAEQPGAVRVGASQLGYVDTLQGLGVLDACLGGFGPFGDVPSTAPPVADAGTARDVPFARSFVLDGSASRAAPGRHIDEYHWRLLPPSDH